jgi:predicted DNA-binding antitoxin AbrB/MazE fold protein
MSNDIIRVASFDIGKKNFAFCIEEFDVTELKSLKPIPTLKRYNPNGSPSPKMQEILDAVYSNGTLVLHKNVDLTENCDAKKKLDPETFHNMIDVLDSHISYWDTCSAFVIEEQMAFGSKLNKMAVKLGQHCYSYFSFKYGRFKDIIEFPAYHKTQVLGAPKIEGKKYKNGNVRWKAMEKPQRKKWAVEKAVELLTSRGESDIVQGIKSKAKRDDLADVVLQLQAYKYLAYVEGKV